ncbi:MAG: hypothetical protein WDN10_00835 [bacterium]
MDANGIYERVASYAAAALHRAAAEVTRFIRETPARFRRAVRTLEFWLTFAAYAIPLVFLLYVLYVNFLPFGYSKNFTIEVGSPGDTSGPFRLEPSRQLSERKVDENGIPYRELNGLVMATFDPGVALKNARVTVSVEGGPGIEVIPPHLDFDPDSVDWDYSWDFSTSTPGDLVGDSFHFDGCEYFDGKSKLELPGSADMFEDGPFTVYAEWTPEDPTQGFQEIVGHYNWELLQNKSTVSFQVGRMTDAQGPFYVITYPIKEDFFNSKHSAFATYSPFPDTSAYIELYIDENLVGRTYIETSTIWKDYNGHQNLTFGKAGHGTATFYRGCLYKIGYSPLNLINKYAKYKYEVSGATLNSVLVKIRKKA